MDETQNTNSSSNVLISIAVLIILLIGGYALFNMSAAPDEDDDTSDVVATATPSTDMEDISPQPTDDEDTEENTTEDPDNSEDQEADVVIEVEGGSFYYTPDEIRVNEGDTVKVIFTNAGGMHDFVIDEFDVATEIIEDGQMVEVEFVADEAGTYEYYCSVGEHRAMGMWGTLIVE